MWIMLSVEYNYFNFKAKWLIDLKIYFLFIDQIIAKEY